MASDPGMSRTCDENKHFRIYYKRMGGHIHVRVFTPTRSYGRTYACVGGLTFNEWEWVIVQTLMNTFTWFIDETQPTRPPEADV